MDKFHNLQLEQRVVEAVIQDNQDDDDESPEIVRNNKREAEWGEKEINQLLPHFKLKALAMKKMEEREKGTGKRAVSPTPSRASSYSSRYSDDEDANAAGHNRRALNQEELDLAEILKLEKRLEEIGKKSEGSQKAINEAVANMPSIQQVLSEQHDMNDGISDEDEIKIRRLHKIHRLNVAKANMLIRVMAASQREYNFNSKSSKKVASLVNAVLDGTYNYSANEPGNPNPPDTSTQTQQTNV